MALVGGAMLKQIRIGTGGRIVAGDRRIHTTAGGPGGPDEVEWIAPEGESYTISFRYLAGSPFKTGHSRANPHDISVPQERPLKVRPARGTYKYDVVDAVSQEVRDDPDVIIE